MSKIIYYPTITSQTIRHICAKPGPKPLPEDLKRKRVDLTLDPEAIKRGQARAGELGLNFSRYVESLIYADSIHTESV